ncbi:hypothetical protein DAPPUDRAFT_334454 [Daphnia pulex]|uniref:Uncharacterized protein n=1 Tax=Daphnia pulex TaxID=6669 RepID=E9HVK6_DAPPU|nr:hypothetical protein DAPPUDRAFT_334454 [Daphnia pulex]|eukprot:EFX64229.1 hypothetical protein DAPPUDRAFT_334454 [Daphnia pulex]
MVTVDKVDPVRVENVVRDRPGTLMVLAFNVETVSVEASVILFPEKVDAVIVEAVNELPISVENEVDTLDTLVVIVDVTSVEANIESVAVTFVALTLVVPMVDPEVKKR